MKDKKELKQLIYIFLLSRLIFVIFSIINNNLNIFEFYDGEHYITIAKDGYIQPDLYAFFPLYPLLIKILHFIIPSYQIAGILISNISAFISLLILNKILEDRKNKLNLLCFVFSPILAFTSVIYTESIFLLLTLSGYYFYKKDRLFLSALFVGLSILTRNYGIILWGAIGIDLLHRFFILKDKNLKFSSIIIFTLISSAIGMLYSIYLYNQTGDFLKFFSVQYEYWGRESVFFVAGFFNDIIAIMKGTFDAIEAFTFVENWAFFIFAAILGIKIFKKDKVSSIYVIISLLIFTISFRDISVWDTLASVSLFRYILSLFPIYLYLFDNASRKSKNVIVTIFFVLSIINTVLYSFECFIA